MSRKLLFYILPLVLFAIGAGYVLVGQFSDMLFTAQDRNEFFSTSDFFRQLVCEPFGLLAYVGSYLTQYFYYPACGAAILLLLWAMLYAAIIKAFGLSKHLAPLALLPLACLCVSIVDVGYWIYILLLRGYWFSETIAVLVVMLMLWAARCTPARYRAIWYLVGSVVAFPLIGWGTYLFALCFFATQCAESADRRMPHAWCIQLCGLVLTALVPLAYGRFVFTEMNMNDIFLRAGLPYFQSSTVDALRPSYPFLLLALFLLLLSAGIPFWRKARDLGQVATKRSITPSRLYVVLTVLAAILFAGIHTALAFDDYNYQAEMRMNQAAMEDDWQAILGEAERCNTPSRTMVLLKNAALINTGELGNRSFALENSGLDIYNPDSLNLNVMQIASPVIYYQFGKVQYAYRWCMENTVAYGFSPYYLKMFVRAAQESGEKRLMKRYMHLLSLTRFHGDWHPLPSTKMVHDLNVAFSDVIDSDNNDLERYLIQNFSLAFGSDKAIVKELNLFYAMIYRDPQYFWPAFNTFAQLHMMQRADKDGNVKYGTNLPVHYQEAYLIMHENYPVTLPYEVIISPMVEQSYQMYKKAVNTLQSQGMDERSVGEATRDSWKHTYWWYIMYGRKSY